MPTSTSSGLSLPRLPAVLVEQEAHWRAPSSLSEAREGAAHVAVSRWTDPGPGRRYVATATHPRYHTIGLTLRAANLAFFVAGRTVHDGHVEPGMLLVTGPARAVGAEFRGSCDLLHIHVATDFLVECREGVPDCPDRPASALEAHGFAYDLAMEQLARALLAAETCDGPLSRLYAEGLSLAIVTRLLSLGSTFERRFTPTRSNALPQWRLKRAAEYVDVHLSEPITLAALAASAGLSRMHFATQFRAATGLRPHEYVLRRRIDRAQRILLNPRTSVIDAALSVGFQTHAHFSAVFKRLTGETPGRWRQLCRTDASIR